MHMPKTRIEVASVSESNDDPKSFTQDGELWRLVEKRIQRPARMS